MNFIGECRDKKYDDSIVLHSHHIIPKHIHYDIKLANNKNNLVKLSVDDHVKAHILLSEMYEEGTYEYISNLRSSRIISNKSIKDKKILNKISETYKGENNPFYGKTFTGESLSKVLKQIEMEANKRRGSNYETIYGSQERADIERKKRSKKTRTDEEYKRDAKKISKALKGRGTGSDNPFAQPYEVDGKYFGSRTEVVNHFEKSFVTIKKYHKVIKLPKKV